MHQKENYKMLLNVKGNGAMYKEFKFKNTNWIVMSNFYKSPFSFSKDITCSIFYQFQHFLYHWLHHEKNYKVCLNGKRNGATYKEFKLKNINWTIMFSVCKSPFFTFKGHNFISSSISTFFVPLAVTSGELQNLFEA